MPRGNVISHTSIEAAPPLSTFVAVNRAVIVRRVDQLFGPK